MALSAEELYIFYARTLQNSARSDANFLGRILLPLLTLGGISLWMYYYDSLGQRWGSKVPLWSRAGRLIKRKLVRFGYSAEEVHDAKEDYISQLPDDVLSSIIARLPVKDIARTSFLSRRWQYLFASMDMRTLIFDCLSTFGISPCQHDCSPYHQQKYLKGLDQVLQLYSGRKVDHVRIVFCFGKRGFSSQFGRCMHSVSGLDVEKLSLYFDCGLDTPRISSNPICNPSKFFEFSLEPLSHASSLKHLVLYHCIVQPTIGVRLSSLMILSLTGVLLESGHLERILSSCPNLDKLRLDYCKLPCKIRISSTVTSLVFYVCGGLEEIVLQAPNLRELECDISSKVKFNFSFVPMLEFVAIKLSKDTSIAYIFDDFARDLPAQVRAVTVKAVRDQIRYFPTAVNMFRNLRELALVLVLTCDVDIVNICRLLDACPLLQSLVLTHMKTERESGRVRSPSPIYHTELKEFTFGGFRGSEAEIEFALYILRSAAVLERMILSKSFQCYVGCGVVHKLLNVSLNETTCNSVQGELHGQAISPNVVMTIE